MQIAWWTDNFQTEDGCIHVYHGVEYEGSRFELVFEDFGPFQGLSEEHALSFFQEWYDVNIKAPQPDLRDQVRESPLRDLDTDLG
jgi:hypothetical protein